MRILVDADACPVKDIIENLGREYKLPVIMVSNVNHLIKSEYSQVIVVDGASQAADIVIVNNTRQGDIVVTQDYGLASMALGKNAKAIHPLGKLFTNENIDGLLMQRYVNQKARMSRQRITGPKKRNAADNNVFEQNLRNLIEQNL